MLLSLTTYVTLHWTIGDALVLIDEADVFLEARTSTEIARNALGKKILDRQRI